MAFKSRVLLKFLLWAGCILVPAFAQATNYTVAGPSPGQLSGSGALNGTSAPWSFANNDTLNVPSGLGFSVSNTAGAGTNTVQANQVNITVSVQAGAQIASNAFGDPTFQNFDNGSITLNLIGGTAISTGQSTANDLFFSDKSNAGALGAGATINISDSGGNVGSMTGTIVMSPYVAGSINLNGTGSINTTSVQLGQALSCLNIPAGSSYQLNFNSTGTVTGAISVAGAISGSRNTQINVGSSGNVTLGGTVTNVNYFNISGTLTTGGAITGLDNALTVNSTGAFVAAHTVSGTGTLTNNGAINIFTDNPFAGLSGTKANNASGQINVNAAFTPSILSANAGTINVNSGGSISGNLTGTATTAVFNVGESSAVTLAMSGTIAGLPTISTVKSGTSFTANGAVSDVNSLTIGSGTTAIFNSTLGSNLSNATITNNGTLTFNTTNSFTFSSLSMASGSILNLNGSASGATTYTLGSMTIGGTSNTTGSVLMTNTNAAGKNLTVTSTTAITNLSALTLSALVGGSTTTFQTNSSLQNIGTVTIGQNCTLEMQQLQSGASISGLSSIVVNGTLQVDQGSTLTLNSNSTVSGSSTGIISNFGQITADGAFSFGGSFTNQANGVFTVAGTPTLSFSGSTFKNFGNLIANFTSSNRLPLITTNASGAGLDLTHGTIQIGYTNNYIAAGNYTFLTAGSVPTPGAYVLPQTNFYITGWSLATSGNSLVVTVTRDGFGAHALTQEAQEIGNFLETIGQDTPTQSQLDLLNALEKITNDVQLTAALESLLPPQYTMLVTQDALDALWGGLEIRLANVHSGFSSGDEAEDLLGFWVRPFHTTGNQATKNNLQPFTNKNNGWIIGFDREFSSSLLLGLAASSTRSTVTDTTTPTTITHINTYMLTFYGTWRGPNDAYLDALLSGGVSNYHGIRTISFPGFLAYPSANYSSQQFTFKAMASQILTINDFWQLTPWGLAQYSFIRQLPWTETGAGSYSIACDPDNTNLFRIGLGANLELPFTSGIFLSIPGVYAGLYFDVQGGADVTNSAFIDGGPIITNSVQQSRMMAKIGGSYELQINKNFEFIAAYDYIVRHKFKGTEAFLNFRYNF